MGSGLAASRPGAKLWVMARGLGTQVKIRRIVREAMSASGI